VTTDPVALELVEAAAVADAFGDDAVHVGGAVCAVRTDIPEMYVNRVLGLGVSEPATAEVLDAIAAAYGSVRHTVALAPCARPHDLADELRARGYEPGHAWVKFSRPAADAHVPPSGVRVARIGADGAGDYVAVIAAGFGIAPEAAEMLGRLPGRAGWGCYLGYAGSEPVAAGAVYVSEGAAWLGQATTLPAHRGRGAHSALIAARIREAHAAGAQVVVTETGELADGRPESSYRNLLRARFEPAYIRPNYASPPEDAVA
jgi:GNAT superfamily N-acetyltransferase